MLGGDVTFESESGSGSTFRVVIATGSLAEVRMLTRPSEAVSHSAGGAMDPRVAQEALDCRVLLAEDGADNRRLISHILKKAGAHVSAAENGRMAVELAMAAVQERRPFDLILMDMQMPIMDGHAATRRLRSLGYTAPIVALTAQAMSEDRTRCLACGCDEFLSKPIDRRQLIEAVRFHAGRPSPESAPDEACETLSGAEGVIR
jgi:CheY-like chemotaxis protein